MSAVVVGELQQIIYFQFEGSGLNARTIQFVAEN